MSDDNKDIVVYSPPSALTQAQLENIKREVAIYFAAGDFGLANIEQGLTRALIGRYLGLTPAESLMGLEIVEGQLSLRGKLVASLIDKHPLYNYIVEESNDKRCTVSFEYKRDGEWVKRGKSTWTMDDARRAGLANKFNWKSYPVAMLFYRALTQGARMFAAPAIMGGYSEGELDVSEEAMDYEISLVDHNALLSDITNAVNDGAFNMKQIRDAHPYATVQQIVSLKKMAEEALENGVPVEIVEGEFVEGKEEEE